MAQVFSNPMPAAPFLFLDIPNDIRLLVHEHLVQLHGHSKIEIPIKNGQVALILVVPGAIVSVYLTCRFVHAEYIAIMQERLAQIVHLRTVPHIAIPAAHAPQLAKYDGLIDEVLNMVHFVICSPQYGSAE
jgi:hypothetical protein